MTVANEVKIQFTVDPREDRGVKTETVWAEPVGQGRFRILNNPFFIFGVSAEDIVAAEEADGILKFQQVVARGGHSSYRIFLQGDRTIHGPDFRAYWEPISAQGATFENANDHFVSIDIPPEKNVAVIYRLLERGEEDGIWAFEEVHYGGLPRDEEPGGSR